MTKKKITQPREIYESEFNANINCIKLFEENDLSIGRMITMHKGEYCKEHQGELVIFNANVITKRHRKIWYGDLNLNLDFDKLKNVADILNEDLYILMEGDARFGYENDSIEELIKRARTIIKCNKS